MIAVVATDSAFLAREHAAQIVRDAINHRSTTLKCVTFSRALHVNDYTANITENEIMTACEQLRLRLYEQPTAEIRKLTVPVYVAALSSSILARRGKCTGRSRT